MNILSLLDRFNETLTAWIAELEHYTHQQLCEQPDANSWSLGQVYVHLIEDTGFYLQQLEVCLITEEYAT